MRQKEKKRCKSDVEMVREMVLKKWYLKQALCNNLLLACKMNIL